MTTYSDQKQRQLDTHTNADMDMERRRGPGRKPLPTSSLFANLTPEQKRMFRLWARMNYRPFDPIQGIWHPVVQHECVQINAEAILPEPLRKAAEEE